MHRRLSSLSRHERPLSLFLHCKKQHSIRAQSARIPSEYSRVFLDFISFLNNTRSTIKEKVAKIDLEIFFTRWLPFPLRNLLPATRCIPSDSILVIAGGVTRTISASFVSIVALLKSSTRENFHPNSFEKKNGRVTSSFNEPFLYYFSNDSLHVLWHIPVEYLYPNTYKDPS